MSKLGVSNEDHVVVYDADMDHPCVNTACRVLTMFRIFGHDNCSVLDGGLAQWVKEGRPTEGAKARFLLYTICHWSC